MDCNVREKEKRREEKRERERERKEVLLKKGELQCRRNKNYNNK